jgi:uncharacterized protein
VIISAERQSYLARLIIDELWGDELIDFDEDQEDNIIRQARIVIGQWVQEQGDIDTNIREKITSMKRGVHEGSGEWNILYKKFFQEEMSRRGSR